MAARKPPKPKHAGGRPKLPEGTALGTQLGVRADAETTARLDRLVLRFNGLAPRAAIARRSLALGLEQVERDPGVLFGGSFDVPAEQPPLAQAPRTPASAATATATAVRHDAVFQQVLNAAEAAFKEATGLDSLRGVPSDDPFIAKLAATCGADPSEPDDDWLFEVLSDATLKVLGVDANANLVGWACAEVLESVREDRALNPFYWRSGGRAEFLIFGAPIKKELHRELVKEAIEEVGLEAATSQSPRFDYALDVRIAKAGLPCAARNRPLEEKFADEVLLLRQVKDAIRDIVNSDPNFPDADVIKASKATLRASTDVPEAWQKLSNKSFAELVKEVRAEQADSEKKGSRK
jgi:hypothetical protein